MNEIESLQQRLEVIEARNVKVEADKAWEVSWTRKISIVIITYIVAVVVMKTLGVENYFASALVPVIGYILSTLSLPLIKKWWISQAYLKK